MIAISWNWLNGKVPMNMVSFFTQLAPKSRVVSRNFAKEIQLQYISVHFQEMIRKTMGPGKGIRSWAMKAC